MKFANPDGVSRTLEKGLGGPDFFIRAPAEAYRLRDSFCGIVSTAIRYGLVDLGYQIELVITEPQFEHYANDEHVMAVVEANDGPYVIDGTYSQYLRLAGLSPGYVKRGGPDLYPEEKIAIFPLGEHEPLVQRLSKIAQQVMDTYVTIPRWEPPMYGYPFTRISQEQRLDELRSIWEPRRMRPFTPEPAVAEVARTIADAFAPQDIQLINEVSR